MLVTGIREKTVVRPGGKIEISSDELAEGTEVEVVVLIDKKMDETDYLLSTEANRERMYEALDELKRPEKFVPFNSEDYEERRADS
jgi:antitoxin YefM